MPKSKSWFSGFWAMIACLGLGLAAADDAMPQPEWSKLVAVPEGSPEVSPDTQWMRIALGQGVVIQRGSQIIVAPMGQAYWAGFSLSAVNLPSTTYWLSLQSPTLDSAQLWWRHGDGPWTAQAQLQHSPPMSFGSGQLFAVWPIDIPAQSSIDVLVRTQGVNRMQFPLVLQSPAEFVKQQQGLYLLMGVVLAVPWVVVFYVLTLMRTLFHPWLVFFLAMAVCETVGALWVSGLTSVLWPWVDRFQTAFIGSMSYGVLMALSIHHARAFLRTPQYDPDWDKALRFAAVCWWLALPLMALFYSSRMRSALLYMGTCHSIWMLVLAWRTYRRHPRPYIGIYVWVWAVYLLSVAVYWLFRWFEWPLITTLGAQFVQGSVVATLLGWSACLQVLQQRQGMQILLHKNTERSRLYAAVQHDLWQPLQSMQLYAKNLSQAKPAQQAHLLKGLQLASSYVDDFMYSLRHLAQNQAKPIEPSQFQSMSLGELLKDILSEFQTLAAMRDVQLRARLSHRCVWVHPLSLQRLVRNLLSNALRYGSTGGKVLLGTRLQGERLWLWCIDRGKGMSQAQLDACFKAFNVNDDSAAVPQSLGLGLFSVKQLASQMHTPVRVHSQEGLGVAIGIGLQLTSPRWSD